MLSKLTIVTSSAGHVSQHALALEEGVKRCGITPVMRSVGTPVATRHVACWGWRIGKRYRSAGHHVLVMERGYLGDRFAWTSLGWNGLNGRATFIDNDDAERFRVNFGSLLKPWKTGGDYVLLIGQVPGDASLGGLDLSRWYESSARAAEKAYGLPVRFRPHPMSHAKQNVRGVITSNGQLADALDGAAVVVTFNSNTAVEAVLAGVPTVAMDAGSMAHAMCGHKVGERVTPEREQWAARLAWCQWQLDEIKSGAAWHAIIPQ